jgi:Protein of unknown function (DUF3224)
MGTQIRWAVIAFAAVGALGALLAAPASAGAPSISVTSTFTHTSVTTTAFHQNGSSGSVTVTQTVTAVYAGDMSGNVTEVITLVVRADGTGSFHGVDTCSCTLASHVGTIQLPFDGIINPGDTFQGHFVLQGGTDGLAGLHGEGTFQGGGNSGSLSGLFHFDQ